MSIHSTTQPHLKSHFWGSVKRRVLSFLRNRNTPTLVGEVSLWIGMSLKQTQAILVDLVDQDLVRELTDEELREHKAHKGYAFVLKDPSRIPMGDADSIPEDILL